MYKYPITKFNYIYAPKIKEVIITTVKVLLIAVIFFVIMAIGGGTYPY